MTNAAVAERATQQLDPAIRKLIDDMSATIEGLKSELGELRDRTPKYQPMEAKERPELAERVARFAEEQGDDKIKSLPVDNKGHFIPQDVMRHLQARFQEAQVVRINPNAHREGWAQGRTWAGILDKYRSDGIGVIQRKYFLSEIGVWKYRVRIKGVTKQDVGDGFYEYELLEA